MAASDIENRRNQIIKIINEEIFEIKRLSSQKRNKPDFMLRLAELNLEKARLWREKENADYLKLPEKVRRKAVKSRHFTRSNNFFKIANSLCLKIVKRFKRYSRLGEAYYILGFNAKEANKQKLASSYLAKATKKTKNKKTKIKTQITLAEVYYNQKKYNKAIPLYEEALKANVDKWWTKDSFNLAWCYYKRNQYSKAISKLKEVHKKSSSSRYIDMRRDVERDIGLFFATSGKIQEGIKFYKNIGVKFSRRLLRIALNLKNQSQYSRANTVLNYALKYAKTDDERLAIQIEKLQLYERDGKLALHLATVNAIHKSFLKGKLDRGQITIYKFQMEKVAASLQRQVISKTYKRLKKIRQSKAKQAINYFRKLSEVDAKKSDEFKYLMAETAFVARLDREAFAYYKDAFNHSVKVKRSKFKRRSMDGMLSVLTRRVNRTKQNNVYVFETYLANWKSDNKAKGIYPRLFNNYMDLKNYTKARSVLDRLTIVYPKDYRSQEAMIAKLMDVSRKKGDNQAIRSWISSIEAGTYVVSGKFKRKLQELLTTLQIEDVQGQLSKGNKKIALSGYHKIINDPYSTKRSKINGKYNLSVLYYELNDSTNAYKWSISALQEMESKDVLNFSSSFITIANFLFTSLEFEKSASLSEFYISKICKKKSRKKDVSFKNAVFIYLAAGQIDKAIGLVKKGKNCRIKSKHLQLAEFEIMRELKIKKDWVRYEYYVEKLASTKKYAVKMIDEYLYLKRVHAKFDNQAKVKKYMKRAWNLYYAARKSRDNVSLKSLDYFAQSLILNMKRTAKRIESIKYSFPQAKFEKILDEKLKLLGQLIQEAKEVQSIGSGVGIVNSFKLLYDVHISQAKAGFAFVPKNKGKEFVGAFKKDFNTQVGEKLKQSAFLYQKEARKAIVDNSILNQNNFYFQHGKYPVKFYGMDNPLLMDRGGIR